MTEFLREEDSILQELTNYIEGTYTAHYKTDGELQTVDIWESLGIAEDVCKGTALKYIMRFGKKDGKNLKDLYKAMHYLVLMVHYAKQHQKQEEPYVSNYVINDIPSWSSYRKSKMLNMTHEHDTLEQALNKADSALNNPEKKCKYNFFSKRFWKK